MDVLFYFHGFNSGIPADLSTSPKILAVHDFCRTNGLQFEPRNIDYRRAEEHAVHVLGEAGAHSGRVIFCGGSMGGWFARVMQLSFLGQNTDAGTVAIAFNPAFNLAGFSHYLEGPQENYVTGERYVFTAEHGERLARLEASVDYSSSAPFWVFVDRDDETISATLSESFHSDFAHFNVFEGGSHRFDHAPESLEIFARECWNERPR